MEEENIQNEQNEQVVCWRCDQDITEDQQQMELLCHHKMHTACFLQIAHLDYYCPHCNEALNPNVAILNANQYDSDHEGTRIRNLYDTNPTFKTFAQKLVKKSQLVKKKETAYAKLIKTKKLEIRPQLLAIKSQLEGLTETKKTEIRQSDIYKEYLSAYRAYTGMKTKLRTEYNCTDRKLARALENKVGFRRFNPSRGRYRYWRSPLARAFYYNIRI